MCIWLLKCDFDVAIKELNAQTFRYFDLRVYRKNAFTLFHMRH